MKIFFSKTRAWVANIEITQDLRVNCKPLKYTIYRNMSIILLCSPSVSESLKFTTLPHY